MFRWIAGRRTLATCAVLLEHDGRQLFKSNAAAIKAANKLAGTSEVIGVAVVRADGGLFDKTQLTGLSKLVTIDAEGLDVRLAEQMAPVLAEAHQRIGPQITHWLTPHSSTGKDLFPRLAAILGGKTAVVADITEVLGENSFKRPIYAGSHYTCHG